MTRMERRRNLICVICVICGWFFHSCQSPPALEKDRRGLGPSATASVPSDRPGHCQLGCGEFSHPRSSVSIRVYRCLFVVQAICVICVSCGWFFPSCQSPPALEKDRRGLEPSALASVPSDRPGHWHLGCGVLTTIRVHLCPFVSIGVYSWLGYIPVPYASFAPLRHCVEFPVFVSICVHSWLNKESLNPSCQPPPALGKDRRGLRPSATASVPSDRPGHGQLGCGVLTPIRVHLCPFVSIGVYSWLGYIPVPFASLRCAPYPSRHSHLTSQHP